MTTPTYNSNGRVTMYSHYSDVHECTTNSKVRVTMYNYSCVVRMYLRMTTVL